MTDEHPIWTLAKEALKIQGGTIHQLARILHIPPSDTSDLLLVPDELCFVRNGATGFWYAAKFISYDVWHNKPHPWVSCTVREIHSGAVLTRRVGAMVRARVREEQRGDL